MDLLVIITIIITVPSKMDCISWSVSAPLPFKLAFAAVGTNANHSLIYFIGGETTGSTRVRTYTPYIYQFDGTNFAFVADITDTVSQEAIMQDQLSTVVGNILYFAPDTKPGVIDIYAYNTETLAFIDPVCMPFNFEVSPNCLTSNDTHLFLFVSNYLVVYDIAGKWWDTYDVILIEVKNFGCGYYSGVVYTFGGFTNATARASNAIGAYTFASQHWELLNVTMTYAARWPAVILPNKYEGVFYIMGGSDDHGDPQTDVNVFDAGHTPVSVIGANSLYRGSSNLMLALINGQIHVMGGDDASVGLSAFTEVSNVMPTAHPTRSPLSPSPTTSPTLTPTTTTTIAPTIAPTTVLPSFQPSFSNMTSTAQPTAKKQKKKKRKKRKLIGFLPFNRTEQIVVIGAVVCMILLAIVCFICGRVCTRAFRRRQQSSIVINNNVNVAPPAWLPGRGNNRNRNGHDNRHCNNQSVEGDNALVVDSYRILQNPIRSGT